MKYLLKLKLNDQAKAGLVVLAVTTIIIILWLTGVAQPHLAHS